MGSARAPVYLWVLFLLACAAVVSRARLTADLSAFLPHTPTPQQQVLVDQLREGAVSQLVLIGLEGAPQDKVAVVSEALTERLARDPAFIYANNGAPSRVEADGKLLLEHRYLLSPGVTAERFTVRGLRTALEDTFDLLASPVGALASSLLPADPTGEFPRLLELFQVGGGPDKVDGVWFSADGSRALVVARTRAAGFDLDGQEQGLARLRAIFAEVAREHGVEGARLVASGPAVFAVSARAQIKEDVARISALATALVCALLLVVFRSPRVLLLTLLPVATGATAGMAAVSLAFGSVHGATLGFGATLLGEGVDYAIYLFTQAGPSRVHASGTGRLWRTLRLGVLTSVCGFGVMLWSDFPGLAQLGLFSIIGLLVAFAVTRLVLPGLLPADYRVRSTPGLATALLGLVQMAPVLRYPVLVLVALCAAWLAARGGGLWDERLESLSPVAKAERQLDEGLRRDLGAPDPRYIIVIERPAEQSALEAAEKVSAVLDPLTAGGVLSGYDSPAHVLPSESTQKRRRAAIPDDAALRADLMEAARESPFRVEVFEPFLRDASAARSAPLLQRADLGAGGLRIKLDSLLGERRGAWIATLPLRGVQDAQAVGAALAGLRLPSVQLLDFKREADGLYRSYRDQALVFALIGAVAITLVLLASLRSVRRTWEVMAPLAAALVVACTLLTLGGRQLTLFHLVGMLLVVGVGSNYTLFFERQTFAASDPERIVTALALCNASTVIGFGVLSLARAPVLSAIGVTAALGAFLSLLFAAALRRAGS